MPVNLYRLMLPLFVWLWMSSAAATVTVAFTSPESYTDIGWYRDEPSIALKEIEAHLKQLGDRYLAPDQLLKIDVLDVDLAGKVSPSSRLGRDVRILRGKADWPRITLRYVLEADGRVLADRREDVADMNYLQHPSRHYSGLPLPYEKRMLDHWFKQRFAARER